MRNPRVEGTPDSHFDISYVDPKTYEEKTIFIEKKAFSSNDFSMSSIIGDDVDWWIGSHQKVRVRPEIVVDSGDTYARRMRDMQGYTPSIY